MNRNTGTCWRVLAIASGLLIAAAGAVHAQTQMGQKYQPFNVKTGLWQNTNTYTMAGNMPIPAGAMDKLTPEQRARMQEAMKGSMGTKTFTNNHCVTKEDLQNPFSGKEGTWTILESTGSSAKGKVSCQEQGIQLDGTGEFEAVDAEHMKGSAHLTSTGGGNTMTTDVSFTSKWMGASCKGAQ